MKGLGPVTQLNQARRARGATTRAPWDTVKVEFQFESNKPTRELHDKLFDWPGWPTGWEVFGMGSLGSLPGENKATLVVIFKVTVPVQAEAGSYIRAGLSLLA